MSTTDTNATLHAVKDTPDTQSAPAAVAVTTAPAKPAAKKPAARKPAAKKPTAKKPAAKKGPLLRERVDQWLAEHPGETTSPGALGKLFSTGSTMVILDALQKAEDDKRAVLTQGKPRRFKSLAKKA